MNPRQLVSSKQTLLLVHSTQICRRLYARCQTPPSILASTLPPQHTCMLAKIKCPPDIPTTGHCVCCPCFQNIFPGVRMCCHTTTHATFCVQHLGPETHCSHHVTATQHPATLPGVCSIYVRCCTPWCGATNASQYQEGATNTDYLQLIDCDFGLH